MSFIPKTFDASVCDEVIMVTDEDAFATVKQLAAREGVLAGSSGGAAVFAALEVARRLGAGATGGDDHSGFGGAVSVEEDI